MAIYIDIYARLRERELIKSGERIAELANQYERDANNRAVKGAQGRNKKIIAANDRLEDSFDRTINKIDDFINALARQERAAARVAAINERVADTDEERTKKTEDLEAAQGALEASMQNLIYKGQALTKSVRDETRARKDLNDETTKYTKNASAVTRITNKNKKEFRNLASATTKARNQFQSLHDANVVHVKDNKRVTKGLESLKKATKQTARERKKYKDLLKTEGVTARQIEAQTLRVQDAFENEQRVLGDVRVTLTEVVKESTKFMSVQDRARVALSSYTAGLDANDTKLQQQLRTSKSAIESNRRLQRGFETASDSVDDFRLEQAKLIQMSNDATTSSAALEGQVTRTSKAYTRMERSVRDASASLQSHIVDEGKKASHSPFGRNGRNLPDPAASLARNLGALTPLGTVTPGLLLPLGTGFFAVASGAAAAAQAVWLLPAAISAAGAGFGIMQMATMGVSDALTAMMDFNNPEKFAEALRLLSPAAQQFALSIQQLVPTFMELKNAVQDTFFAGLPEVINGLAKTYRDAFGGMAIGVSQFFNDMFKEIGGVLQDPRAQQSVAAMFDGIVRSFQALLPMIGPLTQAFIQIASVGAQVLPNITTDISNMMMKFNDFVSNASSSGDLAEWMMEGWEAVKALGSVVVYFGKMLYEVFGLHGPADIARFKETLFGLIDGAGIVLGAMEKFFHAIVVGFKAITDSNVVQFLGRVIEKIGGIENLLAFGGIALLAGKLAFSFFKLFKFIDDGLGFLSAKFGPKIAAMMASLTGVPAAAKAAGTASGAAAAAGMAAGGAAAGSGFAAKAKTLIKGAGWVGLGSIIAELIGQGLRDGQDGWRDALAKGLDPAFWFNPVEWVNTIRDAFGADPLVNAGGGMYLPGKLPPGTPNGPSPAEPTEPPVMGNDGKPYTPVEPGTPGAVGIPGTNQWGTPAPIRNPGRPSAESDSTWGEIPGIPAGGFPVPEPNPGGGPKPNIPSSRYSLDSIPLGQFSPANWAPPDPKSLMSQLTPNQLSQKGYGYQVDPQQVFDAESAVMQQRAAVEEARAQVLEMAQDNQATEQDKIKAQNNIVEQERALIKNQVQLLEAQRGTWKKLNETTSDQTDMLKGLGAELDADFGISKGLPGIAENIVKFLANITAAPLYGQLAAQRAAAGDVGGGKGLIGAAALSGAFGPQFMQPASDTPALPGGTPGATTPGAATVPGAAGTSGQPLAAEAGFEIKPGLNPQNVSTAGLKPQSMALLSLIQGMPQFAGIPLTSGYRPPGNPADRLPNGGMIPWHPNGRGLDFGLNANDPTQSALGDQLNKFLNDNKAMFGINHTLWKTMQGGNHYNHLHVGLNDGESPLQQNQALKGILPPAAGGAGTTSTSATLGGGSIPLPLPVTIVGGGMPAGLPAAGSPAITPPAGTPGAPPAGSGPLIGGAGGATAPGGGRPAAPPTNKPGWTYGPDGMPRSAPAEAGTNAFFNDVADWYRSQGKEPPPAYAKYGTTGMPTPGATPGAATPLPSPGQGGPIPWTLPPLSPAGAGPSTPAPLPAAGGPPLAPGGYTPPGMGPSQIGAVVGPPEGTGSGFAGISGGILGAAQGAIGAAAGAAGAMGGGPGAGAAAGALAQIGIEELNRAIAFAGQAAGIGVSGLMETFLPTGGSELANNGWLPKILGGIVGARPLLPNFANISGASSDVQAKQPGNTPQPGSAGNVNVTQNNYSPTGNSATADLERLGMNAAAAGAPGGMGR